MSKFIFIAYQPGGEDYDWKYRECRVLDSDLDCQMCETEEELKELFNKYIHKNLSIGDANPYGFLIYENGEPVFRSIDMPSYVEDAAKETYYEEIYDIIFKQAAQEKADALEQLKQNRLKKEQEEKARLEKEKEEQERQQYEKLKEKFEKK